MDQLAQGYDEDYSIVSSSYYDEDDSLSDSEDSDTQYFDGDEEIVGHARYAAAHQRR